MAWHRIRTIKPEFFVSEQVADVSPTCRLLFVGMWIFCDDHGIHPASPKQLKMEVFPGDDITVAEVSEHDRRFAARRPADRVQGGRRTASPIVLAGYGLASSEDRPAAVPVS